MRKRCMTRAKLIRENIRSLEGIKYGNVWKIHRKAQRAILLSQEEAKFKT